MYNYDVTAVMQGNVSNLVEEVRRPFLHNSLHFSLHTRWILRRVARLQHNQKRHLLGQEEHNHEIDSLHGDHQLLRLFALSSHRQWRGRGRAVVGQREPRGLGGFVGVKVLRVNSGINGSTFDREHKHAPGRIGVELQAHSRPVLEQKSRQFLVVRKRRIGFDEGKDEGGVVEGNGPEQTVGERGERGLEERRIPVVDDQILDSFQQRGVAILVEERDERESVGNGGTVRIDVDEQRLRIGAE